MYENLSERSKKFSDLEKNSLFDLVHQSSMCALKHFNLNVDFIFQKDPSEWEYNFLLFLLSIYFLFFF